jgi:Protein of unknown function (DUF2934)
MGKSASEYVARLRERAHAIWDREGRPVGEHERHWAMAEEELRSEGRGRAGTSGTEEGATAAGPADADEASTATGRSLGGVP